MKRIFSLLCLVLLTAAPSYVGQNNAIRLDPGVGCVPLFNVEQPTTGTFSQQVSIPTSDKQPTTNISFELTWSGNPGAFNIQVQDADTDATGNYVTVNAGTVTSTPLSPGSTYVSRLEFNPWRGLFGRLYVQTQATNAVNLTAKVCR